MLKRNTTDEKNMVELVLRQRHPSHNTFKRIIKVSLAKLKHWRQNSRTRHQFSYHLWDFVSALVALVPISWQQISVFRNKFQQSTLGNLNFAASRVV